MIATCPYCSCIHIVPGPRNKRVRTICKGGTCRIKGLLELAEEDMLSKEEADELNAGLEDSWDL